MNRVQTPPEWLKAAQSAWTNRGDTRPPFALDTKPGEESVWDYPRPPALVPDSRTVEVFDNVGSLIARTQAAIRLLETAGPPTFYLPESDIDLEQLPVTSGSSFCEWKGEATYRSLATDPTPIAWGYLRPFEDYAVLLKHLSFYPGRVMCKVDGQTVRAQPGGFYGGWITDEVIGPFKGEPGTSGW